MRIHNLSLQKTGKFTTLSADITFTSKKTEHVYFRIDSKYRSLLTADASPFLAAFLLPCMKKGEDIQIEGNISKELYQNTQKIMQLVQTWHLGLHQIKITASHISKDTTRPKYQAAFFSAGVDSFYTYLKHQQEISHFILIHGFDIELENKLLFQKTRRNIQSIAKKTKTTLITVKTNITPVIESKLVWDYAHGGALAAIALMLRKGMKDVFISSAVRKDQLFPYGTHPMLDKLWSSEHQTIHHDGTEYTRLEKVLHTISKSPLALANLRVCNQNSKGNYNCSKCFKCLITMLELMAAGCLEQATTFKHKLDLQKVRAMRYDYKLKYNLLAQSCLDRLRREHREPELQQAIQESLERSKTQSLTQRLTRLIAYLDQTYNERRLYQYIFKMNKTQDRNKLFKILAGKGIIK